jgi:hypothetical protein
MKLNTASSPGLDTQFIMNIMRTISKTAGESVNLAIIIYYVLFLMLTVILCPCRRMPLVLEKKL